MTCVIKQISKSTEILSEIVKSENFTKNEQAAKMTIVIYLLKNDKTENIL